MSKKTQKDNEIKEQETVLEETSEKEESSEEKVTVETVEKEKYDELYDKYLRVLAEYDNYKKRTQKEKEEMYGTAVAETIEKLLPVADNLERAISVIGDDESANISEGVKMVTKQFFEILEKIGVSEIKALGEQFDPNVHNAVMHVDDEAFDTNVVAEEFMKGYKYKDKVIRHSMVKVAN